MSAVRTILTAVRAASTPLGPALFGVACSGGADSMALADAAIEVAGAANVVVLTIDHGLRAGSADVAEAVAAWARGRGAAAVIRRVEVSRRGSIEAAAREARYAALQELAEQLGLTAILVGHTARDQAETVLIRLLRGTGPAGLAGIPRNRELAAARRSQGSSSQGSSSHAMVVRPLLAIERGAIDAYVAERGLPTWADPMNSDFSIARVRVREQILPALRAENPQLDAALVRLADSAGEWLAVIDSLASPFARFPIDCMELAQQPPAIRKRAVAIALESEGAGYDASHLEAIDDLVIAPTRGQRSLDLPDGRFVRSYDRASLVAGRAPISATPSSPTPIQGVPDGCALRIWQAGDRMRPARLKGRSRKLSDLFVDGKVPQTSRTAARVIERVADRTIVWAEHVGIAHDSVIDDEERQKLAGLSLIWPA